MNIATSQITIADLDTLHALSRSSFYESFSPMNTEENMEIYMQKAFNKDQLKKEIENKESQWFFCMVNGIPAGYLKVNFGAAQTEAIHSEGMEVERIYILKEYQKQRLGKNLMEKAIQLASERNLKYVWLGVWEHNLKAIHFYEKLGFIAFSSHPFYLGSDLQKDLLMKLQLPES